GNLLWPRVEVGLTQCRLGIERRYGGRASHHRQGRGEEVRKRQHQVRLSWNVAQLTLAPLAIVKLIANGRLDSFPFGRHVPFLRLLPTNHDGLRHRRAETCSRSPPARSPTIFGRTCRLESRQMGDPTPRHSVTAPTRLSLGQSLRAAVRSLKP